MEKIAIKLIDTQVERFIDCQDAIIYLYDSYFNYQADGNIIFEGKEQYFLNSRLASKESVSGIYLRWQEEANHFEVSIYTYLEDSDFCFAFETIEEAKKVFDKLREWRFGK